MRLAGFILAVTVGYAALGKLGFALAIPPDYLSPVFPAAGFAVAIALRYGDRALAGIWLGSFALTLDAVLASGAALQAWIASKLVQRWIRGQWRQLEAESDIASFLAIAGPVACFVSPTLAAAMRIVGGQDSQSELLFTWGSAWLADTLGVVTFAPLTLIVLLRNDPAWQQRFMAVAMPMVITLGLVMGAYLSASRWEMREQGYLIAWGVGAAGLLFAALLQFLMLVLTGRTAVINRKVDEQTVELKHANQQLLEAKQAADSANTAKTRFLALMSHEIRTPMNGILGMAQLLQQPQLAESERKDYTRTIIRSGRTLLALLDDILDLSKVEAGKIQLDPHAFRPDELIADTQVLFAEAAARKRLRIEHSWIGPEGQAYFADSYRVQQMLSNLVSNAIKFTERGHVAIEAREVERTEGRAVLQFSVTDTGIGIPPDKISDLFRPFSQLDSSTTRMHGGTGLGLSIVRSLAHLMGGEAGVESRPGEGSTFRFRIRADAVSAVLGERPPSVAADLAAPSSRFAGRVLVVDDDATNRKVVEAMLRNVGVDVVLAEDGLRAAEALTQGLAVDLVLMDVRMPVMDGYAATSRIREWEKIEGRARTPVVALSASAFEEDRQRSAEAGMDGFLAKPIDFSRLVAVVSKWLPAGPATFDQGTILRLFGGNRELARSVALETREALPRHVDRLEKAIAERNWDDAERAAHTAKGLSGQVGGMKLSAQFEEAERILHEGGAVEAGTVSDLRRELALLSEALREWK